MGYISERDNRCCISGVESVRGGILVPGIFLTDRTGPEYLGLDQLGGCLEK